MTNGTPSSKPGRSPCDVSGQVFAYVTGEIATGHIFARKLPTWEVLLKSQSEHADQLDTSQRILRINGCSANLSYGTPSQPLLAAQFLVVA